MTLFSISPSIVKKRKIILYALHSSNLFNRNHYLNNSLMMTHRSAKQSTREKCRPLLKIKANTLFPLLYISNIQSW